jgi:glycosyltransferase involved in cell wall biosynthesis
MLGGHDQNIQKTDHERQPVDVSLGIAITTLNSKSMTMRLVEQIERLTSTDHKLVVCDDGSLDDTVLALRRRHVTVVAGPNRGVAWNKNRGLFYLINRTNCRTILLLDDDILPVVEGWERPWIEAACKFGHVNFTLPGWIHKPGVEGGASSYPTLETRFLGPLIGCARQACGEVGYFDVRFGRWGHEHADLTERMLRAGYGGVQGEGGKLYYVMSHGAELLPRSSEVSSSEKEVLVPATAKVLQESRQQPVHRMPWRNDDERNALHAEIDEAVAADACRPRHRVFFMHIPKTAGSTINERLLSTLGFRDNFTHTESQHGFLANFDTAARTADYVSGHHRLPDILAKIDRDDWYLFTLLRNPVEHLISHLSWVRSLAAPGNEGIFRAHSEANQRLARRLQQTDLNDIDTVNEFITSLDSRQYFDNCQTRYLISYTNEMIDGSAAMLASRALEDLDYVGLTERLPEALVHIAHDVRANIDAGPVPVVNRNDRKPFVNFADASILDFYREAVRWDAVLYVAAREQLDSRLGNENGASQSYQLR